LEEKDKKETNIDKEESIFI